MIKFDGFAWKSGETFGSGVLWPLGYIMYYNVQRVVRELEQHMFKINEYVEIWSGELPLSKLYLWMYVYSHSELVFEGE